MFSVGDLVKWYELYGDIDVAKDAGIGIVVEILDICYSGHTETFYKVYCDKKHEVLMLEERCVEKL